MRIAAAKRTSIDLPRLWAYNWRMLKQTRFLYVLAAAALALTGCKTAPLPAYSVSVRAKPVLADVQRADASLERLPSSLWLVERQVQVEPGVGFTTATVVPPASEAAENHLLCDLAAYNANHPMSPVRIKVK